MGANWDLNIRSYLLAKEFAEAIDSYEAQDKAREAEKQIFAALERDQAAAQQIVDRLVAADCALPDHDPSPHTYGKEVLPGS